MEEAWRTRETVVAEECEMISQERSQERISTLKNGSQQRTIDVLNQVRNASNMKLLNQESGSVSK